MIIISKVILSGAPPDVIAEQTAALASAPLRDLATELAADPGLTVSVTTYDDGRQELDVLHTGPQHHDADSVDCSRPRAVPARTLPIAGPADLRDAVTMIRATLRDITA